MLGWVRPEMSQISWMSHIGQISQVNEIVHVGQIYQKCQNCQMNEISQIIQIAQISQITTSLSRKPALPSRPTICTRTKTSLLWKLPVKIFMRIFLPPPLSRTRSSSIKRSTWWSVMTRCSRTKEYSLINELIQVRKRRMRKKISPRWRMNFDTVHF